MSKISAKDATILVNGYKVSTWAAAYNITSDVDAPEITGFTEGSHNFTPGQVVSNMNVDMFWDSAAGATHEVLSGLITGQATILPEVYALGCPSFSMPFMQANYSPSGKPQDAIKIGTLKFLSYGSDAALYYGWCLQHGTITNTLTGTGVLDPTNGAKTAACGAVLHVWGATTTDTYVIKVQHSTAVSSGYADLITFAADGTSLLAERQAIASGTVNKYRRILATRTGTGDTLGFTVHFFFK